MSARKSAETTRKPRPVAPDVKQRYLSRREAAHYLGFSVEKLIDEVRKQAIAEYDFGHSCKRYRVEDLEAFAAARRNGARGDRS